MCPLSKQTRQTHDRPCTVLCGGPTKVTLLLCNTLLGEIDFELKLNNIKDIYKDDTIISSDVHFSQFYHAFRSTGFMRPHQGFTFIPKYMQNLDRIF